MVDYSLPSSFIQPQRLPTFLLPSPIVKSLFTLSATHHSSLAETFSDPSASFRELRHSVKQVRTKPPYRVLVFPSFPSFLSFTSRSSLRLVSSPLFCVPSLHHLRLSSQSFVHRAVQLVPLHVKPCLYPSQVLPSASQSNPRASQLFQLSQAASQFLTLFLQPLEPCGQLFESFWCGFWFYHQVLLLVLK